ncbi:MAG: hypothetical protein ACFFCV_21650, partial [Promethearchaeota archaeon]
MIVSSNQLKALIEEAKIEERNYNWEKAADLYEQVIKSFLEENLLHKSAKIYDKLGFICLRAVYASETKEHYLNWNEQAVMAFQKAESLFDQTNEKLLSMECKAKALAQSCFVITSLEEARKKIKKSVDILLELIEEYSKANDMKNCLRLSSVILEPMMVFMFICSIPSELKYYSEKGCNLIEKAWMLLKEGNTMEIRTRLLYGEFILMFHMNRWTELTYGDKKQEKLNRRFLKRCEDTLKLAENSHDVISDYILAEIYNATGFIYCIFGSLFVEEIKERVKFAEKGFDLLEKSVVFYKNSRNICGAIDAIYSIDYHAGIFG